MQVGDQNQNRTSAEPRISVITPSYNQGEFIEDTIKSVLNQDYRAVEYIVIDGCSTDNTKEILRRYQKQARVIVEPDDGQVDAIVKGFRMATGEILTWLNSDDVYVFRDALSTVAKLFQHRRDVDLVSGSTVLIDSKNRLLQVYRALPRFTRKQLAIYDYIRQPATFFRSEVIADNELDTNLTCAFDYDLWLRLARSHKFLMVSDVLAGIRRHDDMKTVRLSNIMQMESTAVRKKNGITTEAIPILDRLGSVALRGWNKLAGLELLTSTYRRIEAAVGQNSELATPIYTDGFGKACLRQVVNHRGILF